MGVFSEWTYDYWGNLCLNLIALVPTTDRQTFFYSRCISYLIGSIRLSSKYTGLHINDSLPPKIFKAVAEIWLNWYGAKDFLADWVIYAQKRYIMNWRKTEAKFTFVSFTLLYCRFLFCVISKKTKQKNEDVCSFFSSCHVPTRRVCGVQARRYINL